MVVLDFGGLKDGYGSDMTRMVHVGGDVTDEQREVFEVVRRAQQAAWTPSGRARRARTSTAPRAPSSPRPATASSSSTARATGSA
ncbi:M24 family metallopeptidase [Oerskovia sp. M15]